jgi:3-hydroxyacyl-CoA dehydrogenase
MTRSGESGSADGIAIFTVDNPPVNALSQEIRAALLQSIQAVEADSAIRALVIHGAGRHFVAGADVREFDHEPAAPLLNDVLLRLEALNIPVIAALHGVVLGGGLELALACHYRCATPDVSLGFPEVKLGLLPGSGGTVRMPRLIGIAATRELMLSGTPIDFARARAWGIIDFEIQGDVLGAARKYAHALLNTAAPPRRVRERPVVVPGVTLQIPTLVRNTGAASQAPTILAPGYIVECVDAALKQPFEAALALARHRFEECRTSSASRALRHLFFAERHRSDPSWPPARSISRVAVIGAGTMGSGIALALATSGYQVWLVDPNQEALAAGLSRIKTQLDASVSKGRLTATDAAAVLATVMGATDMAAAGAAEFVIEAVFESLEIKQEVFRALDRVCPTAILATNTSTLDIDSIASATSHREAVVGMHFFSPAHVMRLVEIVRGRASSAESLATVAAVTRKMGKLGIVVGNGFGFVGNRMLYAYGRENQYLLLEGASPTQIDSALVGFGMAMGPNAVGDLAGLDVGYRVRRERKDLPQDPRYYRVANLLVEAGRLGQKTRRGAFLYEAGSREPRADPEVDRLIAAESARLGIERRQIADDEIIERCMLALINEGAKLLSEGIAECAADIDAIWCNGYGFPRAVGGPMWYADHLGVRAVVDSIERYAKVLRPTDWEVAPLLSEFARTDCSIAEWKRNCVA